MVDQFSGIIDARANRARKMVHTCDLQHACCFAHKKDCKISWPFIDRPLLHMQNLTMNTKLLN